MADVVFALCAVTSLACAFLLWRGYRRSRARLLFWSSLCFTGLFLSNVMLIVDLRVLPAVDLALWRPVPAIIGVVLFLYGMASDHSI